MLVSLSGLHVTGAEAAKVPARMGACAHASAPQVGTHGCACMSQAANSACKCCGERVFARVRARACVSKERMRHGAGDHHGGEAGTRGFAPACAHQRVRTSVCSMCVHVCVRVHVSRAHVIPRVCVHVRVRARLWRGRAPTCPWAQGWAGSSSAAAAASAAAGPRR